MSDILFTLSYGGEDSDFHRIDLYDVSQALIGFQRSLALTTHLLINDEIITQSPALKGASIYALPSEPGSWKLTALISAGLFSLGSAQSNSPVGHVLFSLYDYVISQSLGFHVDYNKSLAASYEEAAKLRIPLPKVEEHQADALIEKCSKAIIDMHRPIVKSETAAHCEITGGSPGRERPLQVKLTAATFEFIHETIRDRIPNVFEGRISSYNSNTFKGRIFVGALGRPIAFELEPHARSNRIVQLITTSLFHSALKQYQEPGCTIHLVAFENKSKSGTLKSLTVSKVSGQPFR